MTEVVDFMKFRAARRREIKPVSALADCLLHDTLEDLDEVIARLQGASDAKSLQLDELDRDQLHLLAMMADEFLDLYETLGFNLVEEG